MNKLTDKIYARLLMVAYSIFNRNIENIKEGLKSWECRNVEAKGRLTIAELSLVPFEDNDADEVKIIIEDFTCKFPSNQIFLVLYNFCTVHEIRDKTYYPLTERISDAEETLFSFDLEVTQPFVDAAKIKNRLDYSYYKFNTEAKKVYSTNGSIATLYNNVISNLKGNPFDFWLDYRDYKFSKGKYTITVAKRIDGKKITAYISDQESTKKVPISYSSEYHQRTNRFPFSELTQKPKHQNCFTIADCKALQAFVKAIYDRESKYKNVEITVSGNRLKMFFEYQKKGQEFTIDNPNNINLTAKINLLTLKQCLPFLRGTLQIDNSVKEGTMHLFSEYGIHHTAIYISEAIYKVGNPADCVARWLNETKQTKQKCPVLAPI